QLVQTLEGTALAVSDPVIAEITEGDGLGVCGNGRHIGRGAYRLSKQQVRRTCGQGRLPEILPLVVLQFADGLDGGIIQHPHSVTAVRAMQGIDEVDPIIGSDSGRERDGNPGLRNTSGGKYAHLLTAAGPAKARSLLLGSDTAGIL